MGDGFIEENRARTAYLRGRQPHAFKDPGFSPHTHREECRLLSDMKCPGSPALSCASLSTRAPSEDGSDSLSLASGASLSTCASTLASPGLSLEIEMPKLALSTTECCSLDAFTQPVC